MPFKSKALIVFFILVPSLPPQNVTVYYRSYYSFILNWDPVPQEFANGRIQGYQVTTWEPSGAKIKNVCNTTTRTWISGLKSDTRCLVNISAFTSVGLGNDASLMVTTRRGIKHDSKGL